MEKHNYPEYEQPHTINCPECDSPRVFTRPTPHSFKYGVSDDAPILDCLLPVRVCADCGAEFVDEEGEAVRHEAVCHHLFLHTPRQVLQLRESIGTQVEFSDLTGIGEASLSRWETGASFQSKAYDNYLYLLTFKDNIERLRNRRYRQANDSIGLNDRRFRSIEISRHRLAQQKRFVLRPAA
jgi:DNA-binding transcriptional regulator YiaG